MRKIYIYENDGKCQIEDFVLKTNPKIQKKLKFQLAYIMDKHNAFTEPHVKHFTIEKYRRLYELRVKAAGTMVRVIFYEKDGEVLLLYAFYKRDRKDTEKALETSLKILNSISDENGDIDSSYKRELRLR